jgi:glycosyltransferase involved in cell wall biosynthesis
MLSVLIPTYNYNIVPLVTEIHKQCTHCNIPFEVIVFDDASKLYHSENDSINSIKNCTYRILEKNIGRSAIRNLLSKTAQFEHLLFLDADVIPVNNDFITNYIKEINGREKVVYGGILYQKERPKKEDLLRWVYGVKREALSLNERKKKTILLF